MSDELRAEIALLKEEMQRTLATYDAALDALEAERNALKGEIKWAHEKLDEFNVGKPAWSLAGRIEVALRPGQIRFVDRYERLLILDSILLTFAMARQEGSDWRYPVAVLIKLLNGLISVKECREQLGSLNEVWLNFDRPVYHVLKADGTAVTGLEERVARNYHDSDPLTLVVRGELMAWPRPYGERNGN